MDDEITLGPAMMALSPMRRKFVMAMAANPLGSATQWAIAAGYSNHKDGAKVRAFEVMHDPKLEAAVFEFGRTTMAAMGPILATTALLRIVQNPDHPQHLRAAEAILNRVGLHELTEHKVTVDHRDQTGDAMIERIRALAAKHGMDASALLGGESPKQIEVVANERPGEAEGA